MLALLEYTSQIVRMSSSKQTNIEEIIDRLMEKAGVKTRSELAKLLGYSEVAGISNWKTRGINWNKISRKFPYIDINYVKYGSQDVSDVNSDEVDYTGAVDNQKQLLKELLLAKHAIESAIQMIKQDE